MRPPGKQKRHVRRSIRGSTVIYQKEPPMCAGAAYLTILSWTMVGDEAADWEIQRKSIKAGCYKGERHSGDSRLSRKYQEEYP